MMKAISLAVLAGALAISTAVRAKEDVQSANFWISMCKADTPECQAYVFAVADMNAWFKVYRGTPVFCEGDKVTVGQMRAIVTKYVSQKPEEWHRPFLALALEALQGVFPCSAPNITGSVK